MLDDDFHINWQHRETFERGPHFLNPPCWTTRTTQKQSPPAESLHTIDSLGSLAYPRRPTTHTMAVEMEPFPRKSREQSHKPRLGLR